MTTMMIIKAMMMTMTMKVMRWTTMEGTKTEGLQMLSNDEVEKDKVVESQKSRTGPLTQAAHTTSPRTRGRLGPGEISGETGLSASSSTSSNDLFSALVESSLEERVAELSFDMTS